MSLAFVQGIHRWPVNPPHKRPATRKMFSFDDVIMKRESRIRSHIGLWPKRLGVICLYCFYIWRFGSIVASCFLWRAIRYITVSMHTTRVHCHWNVSVHLILEFGHNMIPSSFFLTCCVHYIIIGKYHHWKLHTNPPLSAIRHTDIGR